MTSTFHVKVKGTSDDSRVVLWERDTRHPDGEVLLTGNAKPTKVALTRAVSDRIRDGVLEVVEEEKAEELETAAPSSTTLRDIVGDKWYEKVVHDLLIDDLEELADVDLDLLTGLKGVGEATAKKWIAEAQAAIG